MLTHRLCIIAITILTTSLVGMYNHPLTHTTARVCLLAICVLSVSFIVRSMRTLPSTHRVAAILSAVGTVALVFTAAMVRYPEYFEWLSSGPGGEPPWIVIDTVLALGVALVASALIAFQELSWSRVMFTIVEMSTYATGMTLVLWAGPYSAIVERHSLLAMLMKSCAMAGAFLIIIAAARGIRRGRNDPLALWPSAGWMVSAAGVAVIAGAWTFTIKAPVEAFVVPLSAGALGTVFGLHMARRLHSSPQLTTPVRGSTVSAYVGSAFMIVAATLFVARVASQPNMVMVAVVLLFMVAVLATLTGARRVRELDQATSTISTIQAVSSQPGHIDVLTGLDSRDRCVATVSGILRDERLGPCAMIVVDIDAFRSINLKHGTAFGDFVLHHAAYRMSFIDVEGIVTARGGGDSFVVFVPSAGDADRVTLWLQDHLTDIYELDGASASITVSIGVVVAEAGAPAEVEAMLEQAEAALFEAQKRGPGSVQRFTNVTASPHTCDKLLAPHLLRELAAGGPSVVYQPIVHASSGELYGVETLSRWTLDGDVIPPPRFVAVAEHVGCIDELTNNVLRQAGRETRRWLDFSGKSLCTAVNISGDSLQSPVFLDTLVDVSREYDLPPSSWCLEITETRPIDDMDAARDALERAVRAGYTVALDDFGTGFSALHRLLDFPLHRVKLDRATTAGVDSDEERCTMLESLMSMAHARGLTVVAEGVETASQAVALKHIGADYLQGYLFGRPARGDVLDDALTSGSVRGL